MAQSHTPTTTPTRIATKGEAKSRLTLLDAVKVAAMIMMMQGHTLDALVRSGEMDLNTFPWVIWQHVRGFTAPIFLTVSGMLFALTIKRGPTGSMVWGQAWKRVRWSLVLMLIGYILVFPASNIFHLGFVDDTGWRLFFQVNILQLNAVALTMVTSLALMTRSESSFRIASLIISCVLVFTTPFVNVLPWHTHFSEFIASFFSYSHGSYFPIFPFASYMFFGAAVGTLLHTKPREEHHEYLKAFSWRLGSVLLVAGAILYYVDHLVYTSTFARVEVLQSMPSTVLLREGVVLVVISLIAYAERFIARYHRPIELFGKQSLVIYIVHLVILFGTPWNSGFARLYFKSLPLGAGSILAVVVVIATLSIVYCENLLKHRSRRVHRAMQFLLLCYIVFALLV